MAEISQPQPAVLTKGLWRIRVRLTLRRLRDGWLMFKEYPIGLIGHNQLGTPYLTHILQENIMSVSRI